MYAWGFWGLLERREEGTGARDEDARFLIPRESSVGPVRAPCLIQESRFPDAGLPSGRLLIKYY